MDTLILQSLYEKEGRCGQERKRLGETKLESQVSTSWSGQGLWGNKLIQKLIMLHFHDSCRPSGLHKWKITRFWLKKCKHFMLDQKSRETRKCSEESLCGHVKPQFWSSWGSPVDGLLELEGAFGVYQAWLAHSADEKVKVRIIGGAHSKVETVCNKDVAGSWTQIFCLSCDLYSCF